MFLFFSEAIPTFMEKDEAKKAELVKTLTTEVMPAFIGHFEAVLKKNGGKYLVGDGVTAADLGLANILYEMSGSMGEAWKEKFPDFAKYVDSIMGLPNIKKWLEKRPKTDM